jgi:hypothetical protein
MEFGNLQKKYPRFVFENCSYRISKNDLEILFDFRIDPGIRFMPKVVIREIDKRRIRKMGSRLDNLVFNLGLIEMLSYWKATCSPEILIKAGYLNKEQIKWWRDLIIKGMGQFFYENRINFKKPGLFKITCSFSPKKKFKLASFPLKRREILVSVGGGKDSAITLELLKKERWNIQCFSLNPTEAAKKILRVGKCKKPVLVRRKIDRELLELNRKGFLNGHTPFSAYLAFLSILVAAIFGQKYAVFSNERSSNEGNVKYLGRIINHQWSKSFEFEKKFRNYSRKYLTKGFEYFSFLRPLYEIEIARLFSRSSKYFPVFLSCNEAYKTASGTKKPIKKWCGKCSKCLFAFSILYPFLGGKKLVKIFKKNLFEDKNLLFVMQQLTGERGFKPFECVGTKKESLVAFYLSWERARKKGRLPFLLKYFGEKILPKYGKLEKEAKEILNSWGNQHNLPERFRKVLKFKVFK